MLWRKATSTILLAAALAASGCLSPSSRDDGDEGPDEAPAAGTASGDAEPAPAEPTAATLDARARLERARQALRAEDYTLAIRSARWAYQIAEAPDIRGEALFLEGEALFLREEYYAAHAIFERILDQHSGHPRFREAIAREHQIGTLLLKGRDPGRFLWLRVGRESEGVEILERIVEEFPAERFAEDSQFLIATFYFDEREFERAQEAYTRLVEDFPASKWAAISLFQTAECYRMLSRGIRYDPTPLERARKIYRKYLERYPRGDKVGDAEDRIAEIDGTFAEEEYTIARAYLREGKYLSAEVYLRSILRNYPRTEIAAVARETLESLDLPLPEDRPTDAPGGQG